MRHLQKYDGIKKVFPTATKNIHFLNGEVNTNTIPYGELLELIKSLLSIPISKGIKVEKFLDETAALYFLMETINDFIKSNNFAAPHNTKLSDIRGLNFSDFIVALDTKIELIPSTDLYMTILLPRTAPPDTDIIVAQNITLSKGMTTDYEIYSSVHDNVRAKLNSSDDHTCATITIRDSGYPSPSIKTPTTQKQLATLKTIIITLDILNFPNTSLMTYRNPKAYNMSIHTLQKQFKIPLPSSINDLISSLDLNKIISPTSPTNEVLTSILTDTSIDYQKIRAALPWLFDSYFSDSITMSTINTSIALESLFSDNVQGSVTEKIKAKFAYSLGKTYGERQRLEKMINTFYDYRSKIVHGRETFDTHDLRTIVEKTRILLKLEIFRQIDFLQYRKQSNLFPE